LEIREKLAAKFFIIQIIFVFEKEKEETSLIRFTFP